MTSRIQSVNREAGATAPARYDSSMCVWALTSPGINATCPRSRSFPRPPSTTPCPTSVMQSSATSIHPSSSGGDETGTTQRALRRTGRPCGPGQCRMHNAQCTMRRNDLRPQEAQRMSAMQASLAAHAPQSASSALVHCALCRVHYERPASLRPAFPTLLRAGYCSSSAGTPASPGAFAVASVVIRGTSCWRKNGSPSTS